MMVSLNEIYAKNAMWYWCNSAGDINIPGFSPVSMLSNGSKDDLPAKARELYDTVWCETGYTHRYVVCLDGIYGIALGYLFDYPDGEMMPNDEVHAFHASVEKTAVFIEDRLNEKFHGVQVLYGRETDPDGDEIIVFIPYEMRDYVQPVDDTMEFEILPSANCLVEDPSAGGSAEELKIVEGWIDPVTKCKFSIKVNRLGEMSVEKIKLCEGSYEDGTVVVKKLSPDDVRHMVLKYLKA